MRFVFIIKSKFRALIFLPAVILAYDSHRSTKIFINWCNSPQDLMLDPSSFLNVPSKIDEMLII
jgi:hypothetical protein